MPTQTNREINPVERDPRLFVGFMTVIVAVMYVISLINQPATRQVGTLVPLTVLLVVHVFLHWQLEKISLRPSSTLAYIIIQGALALAVSWLAGNIGMNFALFMALIGEAVGLFKLSRKGILAGVYYLTLLTVSLAKFSDWDISGWFLLSIVPMLFFVVIYVVLYMRQIEAREQAQSLAVELEAANRQLSEYAAQVEDLTITNERQRMARELHDTLSQGLAGLILQLEAADAHLAGQRPERAHAIVRNAMEQARHTLTEARRAIDDLRHTAPDDLDTALRREATRFTKATGIPCDLLPLPTTPVPDPVKETVIRTVAEALTNIAKHAQARHVAVRLSSEGQRLRVSIQDDGQGFDASAIPAGHYGLLGIRERVQLLGGQFEIQSESGKGTELTIDLPLTPFPEGEGKP